MNNHIEHRDPPAWLDKGRIPSLDGLRALAVLLVLFAHVHQTKGFADLAFLHAIGRRCDIGVEVFFVISGFLITTLMLREVGRTGTLSVVGFYTRRVLRIVPAYVVFLGVVAVLCAAGQARLTGRDWLASATYTVNFVRKPAWEIGHVWSLSIEEHFYAVWPLVLALGGLVVARTAAIGMLAACWAGRWAVLLVFPANTPLAELWTFTRLDSIAFGCVLAFCARDKCWRRRLDGLSSRNWVLALAGVGLLVSLV